jgi:hypothetical protein
MGHGPEARTGVRYQMYMYQSQTVVVLKRTTTRNERCFGDAASYRELMPPARMSVTK